MFNFVGRFDFSDPAGPVFAWSGTSITMRFTGNSVSVRLKPTNPERKNNWVNAYIDTNEPFAIRIDGDREYQLASGLQDGEHTVTLVKRTEAMEGELQFLGFVLGEGRLLTPPPLKHRRIEFVGDSYTCGYGNEAKGIEDGYKPEQENFSITYAALTAKSLDAELSAIAWSGRGMYSNYGGGMTEERMPALYLRTLPEHPERLWDFSKAVPDIVVINLGTNDFSVDIDREAFEKTYADFVREVLRVYPETHILCTMMMPKAAPSVKAAVLSLKDQGYSRVHFLQYADMDIEKNGIGGDWHPSARTHAVMAEDLADAIKPILKW